MCTMRVNVILCTYYEGQCESSIFFFGDSLLCNQKRLSPPETESDNRQKHQRNTTGQDPHIKFCMVINRLHHQIKKLETLPTITNR
jgi:sulfur relay (sulfurtransferase) complex TusBCD TusD component (DsrE family)